MPPHPVAIFGGASVGNAFSTADEVSALLETLRSLGINHIDTAARYPPTNPGASERLLGEADIAAHLAFFTLDTKILGDGDGSGNLTPAAIDASLRRSYDRLRIPHGAVNVLYTHRPDPETPLEAQAAGLDAQYKKGLFKKLGVSNSSPEQLAELLKICQDKGYVKPSVYQGQYNLICRGPEKALFPLLREHGMTFTAYSPLAGGFLSGRLTSGDTSGTRFEDGNVMGQMFKAQYDKPEFHDAVKALDGVIESLGISKVQASLRWIFYHSALGPDDGVILGASRLSQLAQNAEAIAEGPLPHSVVEAIDAIWRTATSGQ